MLKKLQIKNFRSHRKLELNFHSGVNVIWGLPGSGKTNILRAIDWVMTNKPKFDRVHSHFSNEDSTSVELEFDNGAVKLSKTSKTNEFLLNKLNSYSYTGASIPEPIAQLLNMSEVNVSKQLDPHFLITSTPGDVGRTINRITKIEKIDAWVSKLTSLSNTSKWKIESLTDECDIIEKEIKHYEGIEDLEKEITNYEILCKQILSIKESLSTLFKIQRQYSTLIDRLSKLEEINEVFEQEFPELETIVNKLHAERVVWDNLIGIQSNYQKTLRKIKRMEKAVAEIDSIDGMEGILSTINQKRELRELILKLKKLDKEEMNLSGSLKSKKKEYLDAIAELGTCPVCQNVISLEHIHNLGASL